MGFDPFIAKLFDPATQFYALCWIVIIVISITLHELAHGWMAVRLGDPTPMSRGRLTGNPFVHMGPYSLLALCLCGIAWGQMPIDPSRLRGKHGEAMVSAAGPAANVVLALVALTALGLMIRFSLMPTDEVMASKVVTMLSVAGYANLWLAVFNLMPIPPLDGSHILASYNRSYAQWAWNPTNQGVILLAFFFSFALFNAVFAVRLIMAGQWFVGVVAGL